VCEQLFYMDKKGRVARHGDRRPGWGHEHGHCFGGGFRAYELSADGCRAYRERLEGDLPAAYAYCKRISDGEITEITRTKLSGKAYTVKVGDIDWPRAIEGLRSEAAHRVLSLERGIKRMAELIETAAGR
jgi:hypothetical protein